MCSAHFIENKSSKYINNMFYPRYFSYRIQPVICITIGKEIGTLCVVTAKWTCGPRKHVLLNPEIILSKLYIILYTIQLYLRMEHSTQYTFIALKLNKIIFL